MQDGHITPEGRLLEPPTAPEAKLPPTSGQAEESEADHPGGTPAEPISQARLLLLVLCSALAVMLTFECFKQALKPDIGIWTSHFITISSSSVLATVCAFFALRRYEVMRSEMALENQLRAQAEAALERLSQKTLELERSKLELEREIAGRLEAVKESGAAQSLLTATIESTLDGIMAVDPHGEISACNRRFAEMWGVDDEVLASGDSNRLLLSLLERLRDPVQFFEKVSELYWQPELESYDLVELSDGRCFECFSRPRFEEGRAVGRVWTFHDISELKKLETQLLHAHKMEAVGTLAGGVAHDFNNIMTAIMGYSELMLYSETISPLSARYLEQINISANRAVALIRNLLAYSRKEPVQAGKIECNGLVRNLISFLERLIGADIELAMHLAEEPVGVLADQGQIEQVLVNLVTNARDAMPEGGRLTIGVSRVELGAERVKGYQTVQPGTFVRLTVTDTGSGMDEVTRQRIFEPFFTTKQVGNGTGLGLSISYGIVERHGGFISVESRVGSGTTFSIYLPQVEPQAALQPNLSPSQAVPEGDETVLVVEDNDAVRSLITQVMTAKGYRVIEAVDGEEGVEKFRCHQEEIDPVILDVIMPKKNGGDAHDEIRQMKREVPTIFMSGYTGDIIDRQRICEGGGNFLQKPILPQKLLTLVREVLDQAA